MGAAAHDRPSDLLNPPRAVGWGAAAIGLGRVGMVDVGEEWKRGRGRRRRWLGKRSPTLSRCAIVDGGQSSSGPARRHHKVRLCVIGTQAGADRELEPSPTETAGAAAGQSGNQAANDMCQAGKSV